MNKTSRKNLFILSFTLLVVMLGYGDLSARLGREVISPAEQKAAELRQKMSFGL